MRMVIYGCLCGFVIGIAIACPITIGTIVVDPAPLSEGKWAVERIVLTPVFAFPGPLLGAVVGLVASLFLK
jgi:hypothetical protein